jgi:uncharacterized protein
VPDQEYQRSVTIRRSPADVFAWHERPGAFQRLLPPWERVELVSQTGGVQDGARVVVRNHLGPVALRWDVQHRDYVAGRQFRDVQVSGPFARWEHLHRFEDDGAGGCVLTDAIRYRLPGGPLGAGMSSWVQRRLEQLFRYRHAVTKADLELPAAPAGRVLISGSSGLLGGALVHYLATQGWQVHRLVRHAAKAADEVSWNAEDGIILWPDGLAFDAVVHLAGAGIADQRWSESRRAILRDSRLVGTRGVVRSILEASPRPRVLLSGSATGYYGDTGDREHGETSPSGGGFLAQLCRDWEAAVEPAREAGVRVVALRTGVVLTPAGGALAKMLPAFKAGLGGRLGSGRQWMSWIALDDWLDGVRRALTDERLHSAVNLVAPQPVRNAAFTKVLAHALRRPAIFPVPARALRLALGQMADEALLASSRVIPDVLAAAGHTFRFPQVDDALAHLLGRG